MEVRLMVGCCYCDGGGCRVYSVDVYIFKSASVAVGGCGYYQRDIFGGCIFIMILG